MQTELDAFEIKAALQNGGLSAAEKEALQEALSLVSQHIDRVEKFLDVAKDVAKMVVE